jgi:Formate/nitrite family of transporters
MQTGVDTTQDRRLRRVFLLIQRRNFRMARESLRLLEQDRPGDPDVAALRAHLEKTSQTEAEKTAKTYAIDLPPAGLFLAIGALLGVVGGVLLLTGAVVRTAAVAVLMVAGLCVVLAGVARFTES